MSEATERGMVPALTLGDRLTIALRHSDMSSREMSEYLDLHRNTVSAYMNDRGVPPKRSTLRLWAMATGVSLEWIETGVAPEMPQPPKGGQPAETAALKQLTERKQGRARGGDRDTRRYPSFASDAA